MVKSALALGAILASGAALAAPESLSKIDTAKSEILLEIQANGMAAAKIVKVSTTCDLSVTGSTKAEADKALADAQKSMLAGFNSAGLTSAVLDFSAPTSTGSSYDYPVAVARDIAAEPSIKAMSDSDSIAPAKEKSISRIQLQKRVGISVGSTTDMALARGVFLNSNCNEDYAFIRRPNVELADPSLAQTEAKAKAIMAAKKQAEDYAVALGMRVVRIIRVSEAGAIKEFLGPASDFIVQEMTRDRDRQKPVGNDVPVTVSIAVDFALGPK